jgi:GMP synthase (glutamine-hydrolysing)
MILIVDFGSQTTHLIGRRLRDLGVETEIVEPENILSEIKNRFINGIILSGGPASVYEKGAPTINKKVFEMNIPVLGICYGWQLMSQLLGGKVVSGHKEYGPTDLKIVSENKFFNGVKKESVVFESHGDSVVEVPEGFEEIASTSSVKFAATAHKEKKFYGVQFHPEVHHSEFGKEMLKNFVTEVCGEALKPVKLGVKAMIEEIKMFVGSDQAIGAISGGTDSSVAGALVAKAIGKQFIPVYIESGLMREGTRERVTSEIAEVFGVKVLVVDAKKEFLQRLKGVVDPEQKRKTIGALYIELFERELQKHPKVKYLLQGTTYADFIHSQGSGKKQTAYIKSHHNVGGLPANMKLKLLEPLRYYYTDQVRQIGDLLNLPKTVTYQQPFPGPGHAVRILGEITKGRLEKQVLADSILVDEMQKTGWYEKVFQCWTVLTNCQSTAVKGDGRFYGDVIALRIVDSADRMTADWSKLPHDVLAKISSRIVNEVPDVSRVVYDITTKPPATMEWE